MDQNPLDSLRIDRKPPPARRKGRKLVWLAAGLIVLSVLGILGLQGKPLEVQTARVTEAWPAQAITLVNATGYVVADTKASVASKGTGRLEWIGVREGSRVKAGEVLARLENSDIKAQIAQAVANMEAAKARQKQAEAELVDAEFNLKRQSDLKAQGFVAQSAVDAAQNRARQAVANVAAQAALVRATEAGLAEARVAMDNTIIRAPFAGVVLTKQADVGDVVAPFAASTASKGAVVTMADLETLEVEADVSETNLAKARLDQPCEIQLDALPELRLAGRVARIVPTVDRSKATVKFKIRFDERDPRVLPDMSAKVAFLERALRPDERQPRLAVHGDALRGDTVFVVENGLAQARKIETGGKLGDLIEVKRGLQNGDTVVLKPDDKLKDGAKVVEKKS